MRFSEIVGDSPRLWISRNLSVSSNLNTAVSRFVRPKRRWKKKAGLITDSLGMCDALDERASACAPGAAPGATPGAAESGGRASSAWSRAARDRAIEAQSTQAAPHSLGLSLNVYGNISTTAPLLNNVRTQLTHASSGSAGACLLNIYDDFVGSGTSTVGALLHDCSVDVTASATFEGTAHPQPAVIARDAAADSTATDRATGSPVTGSPVAVSPVAGSPVADGFFA